MKKLFWGLLACFIIALFCIYQFQYEPFQSPYSKSDYIRSLSYSWFSLKRYASGSDNWPITWAADNNQYAAWGDGGGFAGSNKEGRVSLGVAKIEGTVDGYSPRNVWGGVKPVSGRRFSGNAKSYGIICINSTLYMWVCYDNTVKCMFDIQLYFSNNYGVSWEKVTWKFAKEEGFMTPTFVQFGRDYHGARDEYVYIYAVNVKDDSKLKVQKPGEIILLRVPRQELRVQEAYEAFGGFDQYGNPLWTSDISKRTPVFNDPYGVGWNCAVSYNPGLKRYLLTTEHHESFKGNIGLFDAPEPWGPWTTVVYDRSFGTPFVQPTTFFWNFSNKWLSNDGKDFVLVFTGVKSNDSWNTVKGKFVIVNEP